MATLDLSSLFPIKSSLHDRQIVRSQVYISLAAILVAIWIPFDYILDPDHFYFFLILRIIYILFSVICLYIYFKKLEVNYYYIFIANYYLIIILLGIMVIMTDEFYAYIFGYSTIFIGAAALLLWGYRSILGSYVIVAAQIVAGYPIYSQQLSEIDIVGGAFFLLNVLSITLISVYLSHKSAIVIEDSTEKLITLEKRESINTLVSGIAHEINTPLEAMNSLSNLTQIKLESILSDLNNNTLVEIEFRENLQKLIKHSSIIHHQSMHAASLVSAFKAVSVDQHHENEKKLFNVKAHIERILSTLLHKTREYNVNIRIECNDNIEIYSYSDAFFQIITNLIDNSLSHAFTKGKENNISIDISVDKDNLALIYRDNGSGIEEVDLKQIFDPFFTKKRNIGGSGLGMHIVYNIVTQKLNGSISCHSKIDEGVTFTIQMPRHEPLTK